MNYPSGNNESSSTYKESSSTCKELDSVCKEPFSTHKESSSSLNELSSGNKESSSTHIESSPICKELDSTHIESSSTCKDVIVRINSDDEEVSDAELSEMEFEASPSSPFGNKIQGNPYLDHNFVTYSMLATLGCP